MNINPEEVSITIPYQRFNQLVKENERLNNYKNTRERLLRNVEIFLSYICRTREMEKEIDTFNDQNEDFKIFKKDGKVKIVSKEYLEERSSKNSD